MDTARCTRDAVTYTATEFSGVGSELEMLRRELVCARCGARAFFRRRSRDGKAACFGSNDHRPACPAATEPAPRERVDDPLAGLDLIQIDLDVRTNPTEPPARAARPSRRGRRLRLMWGRSSPAVGE